MVSTEETLVIIYGTISGLLAFGTIVQVAVYRARSRMSFRPSTSTVLRLTSQLGSQHAAVNDPQQQIPPSASFEMEPPARNTIAASSLASDTNIDVGDVGGELPRRATH